MFCQKIKASLWIFEKTKSMKKISILLIALSISFACKKKDNNDSAPTNSGSGNTTCATPNLIFSLECNGNVSDASCSPFTVTNNGATFVNDRNNTANKALNFNGSGYLNYPNAEGLKPSLPFTISFWVSVDDSIDWASNYFIQSNARPNGGYCGYLIRTDAAGRINLTVGDTTNSSTIGALSSFVLNSKTWTHYAAVVKGNNDVDIYINGTKDALASLSGTGIGITYPPSSSTANLGLIGGVSFTTNNGRLKGKMDKVKIWNKALTSTEVTTEYTNSN